MTAAAAPIVIDVKNLRKSFGRGIMAVDGLSLTVAKGEIFGFLGPNGAGKTTAIRLMCGLLTPDSGEGSCLGYDIIKEREEIKSRVGYMTQRFSFWQDLTIRENLELVARIYRLDDYDRKIDAIIAELELGEYERHMAGALSGGWKQRLALAACMLHEPGLLFLDEPTAGVDPKARRDFWLRLHQLAEQGVTVLVSTHYMDEAERCRKLAYINKGRILARGTAAEIMAATGENNLEGAFVRLMSEES